MEEDRRNARIERADRFLNEDLRGQRGWYSRKAKFAKHYSQLFSLLIIVFGLMVTTTLSLKPSSPDQYDFIAALFGMLVVVLEGAQRIWKFDEIWPSYRRASESMKREYRKYINQMTPYNSKGNDTEAIDYNKFINRIEAIIAEEQKEYFYMIEKEERENL